MQMTSESNITKKLHLGPTWRATIADEFASRRDERADEMMDTDGGVHVGEQVDDDSDRGGSEDVDGKTTGSGRAAMGHHVGTRTNNTRKSNTS